MWSSASGACCYCGSVELRCTPASSAVGGGSSSGRYITECKACARVVEERRVEVEEPFVERATDKPLCIVTPDFSENERFKVPPLEDDPFESGFITAFSTWSLEHTPIFTNTTSTSCGYLAELERVLAEHYPNGFTNLAGSLNLVDMLRAYFQIVEVSSFLGLERDSSEHAIQMFRDCSSTTYLRNRNIEALATAALVQASREAQEPRTLQEISAAANIPQKEIARHMKLLSDALKLSQPMNSNSISVHMPRFCNLLQLNRITQDLASHIGEVVISKSFCTRRNPISISAAAIYLACQLEDKRKTQTEICKATGLTEVTLRKVYKELLENLDDLLPKDYTPTVPPEKAFPVTAGFRASTTTPRTTTQNFTPVILDLQNSTASTDSLQSAAASSIFRMPSASSHLPQLRPPYSRPPGNMFMMPPTISSSVTPLPCLQSSGEEARRTGSTAMGETVVKVEKERVGLRCDKLDVDLNACGDPCPSPTPVSTQASGGSGGAGGGGGKRANLHDLNMVPDDSDDIVELDMFHSSSKKPPGPDLNGAPSGGPPGVTYDGSLSMQAAAERKSQQQQLQHGFVSSMGGFNAFHNTASGMGGTGGVPFGLWGLGRSAGPPQATPFGLFPQEPGMTNNIASSARGNSNVNNIINMSSNSHHMNMNMAGTFNMNSGSSGASWPPTVQNFPFAAAAAAAAAQAQAAQAAQAQAGRLQEFSTKMPGFPYHQQQQQQQQQHQHQHQHEGKQG